jgi:predicted Zn-dependent protease
VIAQAISIGDLILRGVQVVQLSSISDKQEVALGQQINGQLSRQVRISRDRGLTDYVNQIGQQLAKTSARPQIPYTFQVVDDNGINAFATMGGFVYVNKGLLQAADNEAQFASVVGHEIGHIVGRHSINQMKEAAIASGVIGAAGLNRNAAVNIGVELALRRPHSRKAEYEADQLGIKNLGKAGYAQSAAPAFMSKLMKQSSPPTFFSTHPSPADRVTRLQQQIEPGKATGKGLDGVAYKAKVRSLL